jgi:hypothetical protein
VVSLATSTIRPPIRIKGRVSEYDYEVMLDEIFADTPSELVWPLNIQTYAAMRRDSAVNAIQQGYTLQLRRAQWQLDGRDVAPPTTRMVADDMGLPILGEDQHGAARTRGVSWSEHLRVALAQSLTFGHSGFALAADLSTGQARLSVLAERPPWTISQIHVDPVTGAFLGVTQANFQRSGAPEIPARDMAWYCLDREGANWAGVSMYRSAWLPWLIKREMIRVNATSNRRWGAGVPVMEAQPGTTPTDAQMQAASNMASAARAGEQAGAASPPGFQLKILGLSGAVPDTLGFLEWLGREISRSCLMQHLELGQGDSAGSRALGQAFIDSWMLALETIGESTADTATRHVAARVVEWNAGLDAPVPRVTVAGIGSRREVTAESLQLLLASGGLTADPALEAWIRREYRLPERQGMAQPATSVKGDTVAAANPKPQPKARAALRKAPPPEQLSLPLNEARSDDDGIQQDWRQARTDMLADWPAEDDDLVEELAVAAGAAVVADQLADLGALEPSDTVRDAVIAFVLAGMTGLAATAAVRAVAELATAGHETEVPDDPGGDRIPGAAEAHGRHLISGYSTAAGRKALTLAGPDVTAAEIEAAVREHLNAMSAATSGLAGDTFGAALTVGQNAARADVFDLFPDIRYVAVEKNDANACGPCHDADGTVYNNLASARMHYPLIGNSSCLGGGRCRGHITPDVED